MQFTTIKLFNQTVLRFAAPRFGGSKEYKSMVMTMHDGIFVCSFMQHRNTSIVLDATDYIKQKLEELNKLPIPTPLKIVDYDPMPKVHIIYNNLNYYNFLVTFFFVYILF